jgi:processive 1,2-diacylglycerol beta-glucosyltransferase
MKTLTVTYIPAFHVHPLWAYPGIDMHFVMYDSAPTDARMPGFERSMRVGAPPVRDGFGDFDRGKARQALQLPEGDFVVLVTGGAWGLGDIDAGVEALVKLEPSVRVLAICGKNARLKADLYRLAQAHPGRLNVYGYVSTMAQLMAAANVVVTNGAGVTVLEALRTPRPVVAFAPLAGHGTTSTAEMVRRNLALEARDVPALAEQVRGLRTDPKLVQNMEEAGQRWAEGRSLRRSVSDIEAVYLERTGACAPGQPRGEGALGPVTETTVTSHLGWLLAKLGRRDRAQAVVYAYQIGVIRAGSGG